MIYNTLTLNTQFHFDNISIYHAIILYNILVKFNNKKMNEHNFPHINQYNK